LCRRRGGRGRSRRRLARDAHALPIALDLDLVEACLFEQLRELADEVVID
jgi:hypothetical protein